VWAVSGFGVGKVNWVCQADMAVVRDWSWSWCGWRNHRQQRVILCHVKWRHCTSCIVHVSRDIHTRQCYCDVFTTFRLSFHPVPLTSSCAVLKSLYTNFAINRLFMKLFNTSDISLVKQCQEQINFALPSVALERCRTKFMHNLCCVDFFTWSGRSIHVRSFVLTLHCHCIFYFAFLFHYYFCCIVLPHVVNKDFQKSFF